MNKARVDIGEVDMLDRGPVILSAEILQSLVATCRAW